MFGWQGDGRTKPNWRSCAHEYATDGRCNVCNAKRVEGIHVQRDNGSAIPLGSPLLVKPDLGPMHRAGPEKVSFDTYNGPVALRQCPHCERSYSSANVARHIQKCAA